MIKKKVFLNLQAMVAVNPTRPVQRALLDARTVRVKTGRNANTLYGTFC